MLIVLRMGKGGVVGLKSILDIKNRSKALAMLDGLVRLGLAAYALDEKTKKLELTLPGWVHNCDGSERMSNSVYAIDGYGFHCIPRNITERLVEQNYTFEEYAYYYKTGMLCSSNQPYFPRLA